MRRLIAGNWKMNGVCADLAEIAALRDMLSGVSTEVLICPPATLLERAVATASGAFGIGAQDCSAEPRGAYTGDISAEMLRDAGAVAVILGHSERRSRHGETNDLVAAKARAALRAGLTAIICIGESEAEHRAGGAQRVCQAQITGSLPTEARAVNTVIAYEPVWAIGTGVTPSLEDIGRMHAFIRACLAGQPDGGEIPILYGGSMTGTNAREILRQAEVDGALVGGASLKAADFAPVIAASKV